MRTWTTRLLAGSLLAFCTSLASTAGATLVINLAASIDGNGNAGDNVLDPATGSVYGSVTPYSEASIDNEGLWPEPGVGPCFNDFVLICSTTTSDHARAAGELVADQARFRSRAAVSLGSSDVFGHSHVDLILTDILTFQPGQAVFDTHIGLTMSAFDVAFTGAGHAHFWFEVLLTPVLCPSGECTQDVFYFEARDYSNGSDLDGWMAGTGRHAIDQTGTGSDVGLDFQRTLEFTNTGVYQLSVLAHSEANCDLAEGRDGCSVGANFSGTGYLGITGNYSSESGYRYPGYAAVVPEPSTAILIGAGLTALAARRRERAR